MRLAKFNKYRNATASLATREAWYSDLALDASDSVSADGLAIDGHSLYVKATGGNSLQAIDLNCPGKVGSQTTTLSGPAERIVDWTTALHHDNLVAAADSQGSVTVWQDRIQTVTFDAHASACVSVRFHPTVAGVLATSANSGPTSGEVRLWNVSADTQTPFWHTN
ncbi:Coronin-7, partial [Coemansia sp. RSA 2522]